MGTRLFVGGLAWETEESDLHEAFSAHGQVNEVKIIKDRDTGRPRGFGFVTFAQPESAEKALQHMDGAEVRGRRLRVSPAENRAALSTSGGRPVRRPEVADEVEVVVTRRRTMGRG